jgi:competence protein ComEC
VAGLAGAIAIDGMLAVGAGWLAIGLAGVAAGGRLEFVARVLFPLGGLLGVALAVLAATALAGSGARPVLRVTVLDVGQGLAVVVETSAHVLVYDTGPAYGERFDAGSGIIAPYLRARGWSSLDLLVVSHPDADHSGGATGLMRNFRPGRLLQGVVSEGAGPQGEACRRGQNWRWDGVDFRVLDPLPGAALRDNDRSCVLLVEAGRVRVLLPGDMEADGEGRLLADAMLPHGVDLLVAPHHGSRTSSSPPFVAQVQPAHVVYSAGWHHRFGHPQPQVVARYSALGARNWNTADDGALAFVWERAGADLRLRIESARRDRPHYWERN